MLVEFYNRYYLCNKKDSKMSKFRKPSLLLNPDPEADMNKKIPTFQTPWVHRDLWNDKDWYYSIEGKFCYFHEILKK